MTELPIDHPLAERTANSPLIRAYRGNRPEVTPVWFQRQAGRSLPEYRELRAGIAMLKSCVNPELVTEITMQPVRRHDVDAAILFSDIVLPLYLVGVGVDIVPGKGPVVDQPIRTAQDVAELKARTGSTIDPDLFAPVTSAVGLLTAELGSKPLIGFAGAPFTLAAYLVEGGPSKDHLRTRALMHSDPDVWNELLEWLAQLSGGFMTAQVQAGASAAQLFDSWAGGLSREDYVNHVAPHSRHALAGVKELALPAPSNSGTGLGEGADVAAEQGTTARGESVPTSHFGVGTGHLLPSMKDVGADVLGVDWRTPLDEAAAAVPGTTLQGNIDPALLAAPWEVLNEHVRDVLRRGHSAQAHVLNLGHGVPPDTDPTVLTKIVAGVHDGSLTAG